MAARLCCVDDGPPRAVLHPEPMRFKGYRFPTDIILLSVRWYLRYNLSYRDLEEMLEERGAFLDHTTVFRWVLRFTPLLLASFKKRKAPVGGRWRMDESVPQQAAQEMRDGLMLGHGLSHLAYRSRVQTTASGLGQKLWVVSVAEK